MSRLSPGGRRTDGRDTAQALLRAAGELFAEKGADRATSKEICARAGANSAAVNYYFGGFEALYDAVLLQAHERIMAWEVLADVARSKASPAEKIRKLIGLHLEALLGLGPHAWELRVVSRELMAPSPALLRLHKQMTPRLVAIDEIMAEAMDLPVDSPAVRQAAFCTMTPCVMLLTGPPGMIQIITGRDQVGPGELPGLADRLARYAMGGVEALATLVRREKHSI
ncbi:CerR family C-terminal domain-containing protein [Roseomonas sp. GC11]|uniref:TetR/AcrR family transcriptional regulator n=1 Tax=Roseomonas sp. GC11 TaxID=2950546 RepID=UPI00210E09C2|nr:CerR family C-terminal domain-containing protein [Roseomonas sp. GC11]MCQ4160997.1 CerR family C-terminal domain-containing protein [Roseomonas sp. GC11]